MPRTLLCCALALWGGLLLAGCRSTAPPETGPVVRDGVVLPRTNYYEIQTSMGRLVIRLFDETPEHRDNFKRLVEQRFYDDLLFHRVVEGFVIEGGDPLSKDQDLTNDGRGGPGYTLPAELLPSLTHRRGIVGAGRSGDGQDPRRRTSGSIFYLVHGNASSLDGIHTVFGELVEGFSVLDQIASVPTRRKLRRPAPNWIVDTPPEPIVMRIRPLPAYDGPVR